MGLQIACVGAVRLVQRLQGRRITALREPQRRAEEVTFDVGRCIVDLGQAGAAFDDPTEVAADDDSDT